MRSKILGKRYATALLDLAAGNEELIEQYGKDLEPFAALMRDATSSSLRTCSVCLPGEDETRRAWPGSLAM